MCISRNEEVYKNKYNRYANLLYCRMGNFNNNRSDRGRSDDNRGFKTPQMHSATCSKCGKSCLVPFRPTGNRPIFCSDCFRTEGETNTRRSDDRGQQVNSDRQMYDAICAKCGNRCQIPFHPRSGKEVFCSHCFEQKERGEVTTQEMPRADARFDEINAKLDRVLELLSSAQTTKVTSKNVATKEVSGEIFEDIVEKPIKKKAASKKTPPADIE